MCDALILDAVVSRERGLDHSPAERDGELGGFNTVHKKQKGSCLTLQMKNNHCRRSVYGIYEFDLGRMWIRQQLQDQGGFRH